jgi:mannose-6-phosphate isomerase-like protein (cupin superfamily)
MDLKQCIVPKPWGYEYLIFENDNIGIWWLHINSDEQTSLHCHPDKKTGLILLNGEAHLSFLNGSTKLLPLSKTMIWEGVFHSTKSMCQNGVDMLEVETPKDKLNLVRMEDEYGRSGTEYESSNNWIGRNDTSIWIPDLIGEKHISGEYIFEIIQINEQYLQLLDNCDILILLSDGIVSNHGYTIVKVGDVINVKTFIRLLNDFTINKGAYAMLIRRHETSVV